MEMTLLISVGDIEIFVEVVGTRLGIRDGKVYEKPTVILLHGGPTFDHLAMRPDFEALSEFAQLIFYDHRGLGRSGKSHSGTWNLQTWSRDLHMLVKTLGLGRPIILGQSFGGFVAQKYALDYPDDLSGLVLLSTAARIDLDHVVDNFAKAGGARLGELARAFFTAQSPEARDRFTEEGLPFYTVGKKKVGALSAFEPAVMDHFFSGESNTFDYRNALAAVKVPTLVIGGDSDPATSAVAARELGNCFAPGIAQTIILNQCGHGPMRDQPEETLRILRDYLDGISV
jgi:proline iminopeptidase